MAEWQDSANRAGPGPEAEIIGRAWRFYFATSGTPQAGVFFVQYYPPRETTVPHWIQVHDNYRMLLTYHEPAATKPVAIPIKMFEEMEKRLSDLAKRLEDEQDYDLRLQTTKELNRLLSEYKGVQPTVLRRAVAWLRRNALPKAAATAKVELEELLKGYETQSAEAAATLAAASTASSAAVPASSEGSAAVTVSEVSDDMPAPQQAESEFQTNLIMNWAQDVEPYAGSLGSRASASTSDSGAQASTPSSSRSLGFSLSSSRLQRATSSPSRRVIYPAAKEEGKHPRIGTHHRFHLGRYGIVRRRPYLAAALGEGAPPDEGWPDRGSSFANLGAEPQRASASTSETLEQCWLATDTRDQRSSSTHGSSSRVQSNVVSQIAKLSKMLVLIDILHSAKDSLGRRTAVRLGRDVFMDISTTITSIWILLMSIDEVVSFFTILGCAGAPAPPKGVVKSLELVVQPAADHDVPDYHSSNRSLPPLVLPELHRMYPEHLVDQKSLLSVETKE
ncbi:hypothetical protein B0H13DRAFT_1909716 [Mycena leptocephala]|nr:hypothetical protein B0H13DRAFT_1909716 [Mycena leptocephala]